MELQNSLDLKTLFDLPTPENYQLSWFPWNGSKRWILDDLAFLMNKWEPKGARYFEPFVGGGCVSYLMRTLFPSVSQVIGDANPWLMAAYQNQLQNSKFNLKKDSITPEWIEKQRSYGDRDLPSLNIYDKSLRFATCLLTAWGNRWEASESGEFKSTKNTKYCEPDYLHRRLKDFFKVQWLSNSDRVSYSSWEKTLKEVSKGDLVYLDPPYPETLGYGNQEWRFSDHLDVWEWVEGALDRGVNVVVSNMEDMNRLYKRIGMETRIIEGPSRSKTRVKRKEVLAWKFHE